MIGFFHAGRMGNYLFECATAIGVALKNGVGFSVPNRTHDNFHCPVYLQHLVNPKWVQGRADIIIEEKQFHYEPIEYKKEWDGLQVMLRGYWQSPKYFQEYREEILNLFNYPWALMPEYVSVHVRRGDYVNLRNKHPEVTVKWYENAMSMFPDRRFVFYSDDIPYCKEKFGHRKDCIFSPGNSIEYDLEAGSCCADNIISASTFGWWMAWLNRNPNKKVVLPKLWFGADWKDEHGREVNTKDLIPENWIRI